MSDGSDEGGYYAFVSMKQITLAIADGIKTMSTLMTESLTNARGQGYVGLANIAPHDYGATHMLMCQLLVPYSATDTSLCRFPTILSAMGAALLRSYSSYNAIRASRTSFEKINSTYKMAVSEISLSTVSANNRYFYMETCDSAAQDLLSIQPPLGTEFRAIIQFYKQL